MSITLSMRALLAPLVGFSALNSTVVERPGRETVEPPSTAAFLGSCPDESGG